MEETTRQCWTCKLEFPLELFPKHKASANGRLRHCSSCLNKKGKVLYRKRLEKLEKSPVLEVFEKHCISCKTFKFISEFYKANYTSDRYNTICKSCKNERDRISRLQNLDKIKENRKLKSIIEKPFKTSKTCNKCKEEKPILNFTKQAYSLDGFYYICKQCAKQVQINLKNSERKEKRREASEKYRKKNKEKIRDKAKERNKKHYELKHLFISNSYARTLFAYHNLNEIPQELIEIKRTLLQLKRKVIENEKHVSTS